jgi:predicted TIM-barrel fold metal-dependent hydrolase
VIIDVHSHMGYDEIFEHDFPAEDLLWAQGRNGVDITIVQPGSCVLLETVRRQHDAIAAFAAQYPGRFFGMANPNPHLPDDDYRREVTRCVRDLGFVGVKIHPTAHAVNPAGPAARKVFEIAAELAIPVMIHTGSGVPFSLPSAIIEPARAFPHVPIVMAHSGMTIYAAEAITVATLCPNVSLETTWTGPQLVRQFCATIGADRVLFGSDHAVNQATELEKVRTSGINTEEIDRVLCHTAASLYRLPREGGRS